MSDGFVCLQLCVGQQSGYLVLWEDSKIVPNFPMLGEHIVYNHVSAPWLGYILWERRGTILEKKFISLVSLP